MTFLEKQWLTGLHEFMRAFEVAAESAMGVPEEVYEIAPIAARYLSRHGIHSTVIDALASKPQKQE